MIHWAWWWWVAVAISSCAEESKDLYQRLKNDPALWGCSSEMARKLTKTCGISCSHMKTAIKKGGIHVKSCGICTGWEKINELFY